MSLDPKRDERDGATRSISPPSPSQLRAPGLEEALESARAAIRGGDLASAGATLSPWLAEARGDLEVASLWLQLLGEVSHAGQLARELRRLASDWAEEARIHRAIGLTALRWARANRSRWERRAQPLTGEALLEAPDQLAATAIERHLRGARSVSAEQRIDLLFLRAELLALGGAEAEDEAMRVLEEALQQRPDEGGGWYLLSRIHSRRARWEKAEAALQAIHGTLEHPAIDWQSALCGTALGLGERAVERWQKLSHDAVVGRDLRPIVAGLEPVELRLTNRMRGADTPSEELAQPPAGAPWAEEIVWVQPLSPAHGRLMHPSHGQFPADFGALVIWEGEPLSFRNFQGREVPCFPAIACLERGAPVLTAPAPPLREEERSALAELLPEGLYFYQAAGPEESGKLIYPETLSEAQAASQLQTALAALAGQKTDGAE